MSDLVDEQNIFHFQNSGVIIAVSSIKDRIDYKSCFRNKEHDKQLQKYLKIDDKIFLKNKILICK